MYKVSEQTQNAEGVEFYEQGKISDYSKKDVQSYQDFLANGF